MFVMAIGMLSLLALFPVAFHNAKWALDTEQVARGAANAQSTTELPRVRVDLNNVVNSTAQSVRNDEMYKPSLANGSLFWRSGGVPMTAKLGRRDFLIDSSTNTWTFDASILTAPPGIIPNARVKLPPVFVDPLVAGAFADVAPPAGTGLPFHLGADDPNPAVLPFRYNSGIPQVINTVAAFRPRWSIGIPRASSSQYVIDPDPSGLRKQNELTMGDEIDFGANGQPLTNGTGSYARQRRFTWAYMCHWPEYQNSDICEVTAVVFNSRPTNSGLATLPPGEKTYVGHPNAALSIGIEPAGIENVGRVFRKGLNQAAISLGATSTPLALKVNDWILDSTLILPEYDDTRPQFKVPFLDEYHPNAVYALPPAAPVIQLRPGLVGGHFYKVLDISEVRNAGGVYYQTITIDRPAKSDGFTATVMSGIADVITKGAGKMPQR